MTREIKFRAWDKENNKWYEPTYEAYKGDLEYLVVGMGGDLTMNKNGGMRHESVFPKRFELMQYTGLLDKQGKEIYEGDIVKTFYEEIAVVMYADGGFKLFTNATDYKSVGTVIGQDVEENYLGYFFKDNLEIIGNIYENPELLK